MKPFRPRHAPALRCFGSSALATATVALAACSAGSAPSIHFTAVAAAPAVSHADAAVQLTETAKAFSIPVSAPGVPAATFTNYEVAQVHPMDLTPDGSHLLVTNTANGTLEVFSVNGSSMILGAVIKVGIEPVSVRAASNTQAWVVNEISDSVSVVDIANNQVVATLQTDDEPADVVFAGTPRRAYVSVAQTRELMVFDPVTPVTPIARLPILGQQPRALATSLDGSKVYLGIFESGNGTTLLNGGKSDSGIEYNFSQDKTNPYGGVSPYPDTKFGATYTSLYAAGSANPPPPTSLIVRRSTAQNGAGLPQWLDGNGTDWSAFVSGSKAQHGNPGDRVSGWDLVDRDIAIIDTATKNVTYQGGPLNIVMSLAVNPATGAVTTIGTDSMNSVRFENVLDGRFTKVLFGSFTPGTSSAFTSADLNPHLPLSTATNLYTKASIPASCAAGSTLCRANSIGDPRGIAWNSSGTKAYVTGMGSNNVIVVDATGARAGRVAAPIAVGQGPTGIVIQQSSGVAYVLNRFDATISAINLSTETEAARVALSYDPTPAVIRAGRPMLYDTHLNSGLGQLSCASCHVDAKTDRLAWDLGNPTVAMEVLPGVAADNEISAPGFIVNPSTVLAHPMKGPLLTMTLVDRMQSPFLHWRGDRANLAAFAGAFQTLQGGDAPATAAQITAMQNFLATTYTPPNPYRTLTNAYPTEIAVPGPHAYPYRTGNAVAGAAEFEANCRSCHVGQTGRGALFVTNAFGLGQYRNPPTWQNFYRRDGLWFADGTASTTGFGISQDGSFDTTQNATRTDDMMAFMYAFNGSFPYTPAGLNASNVAQDSHAAIGKQVTLSGSVTADPMLAQLLTLAGSNAIDVVASACINNELRGMVNIGPAQFVADRGDTFTTAQLKSIAAAGSPVTFTAVRRGTGYRIGIDANADGVLDGTAGVSAQRACTSNKAPNLLVNGDFETNGVAAASWANTTLTGWTGSSGVIQVWNGLFGYAAASGNSWIQLDATAGIDTVSQTVKTVAGDVLVLRFWYSARPGVSAASNQFNVSWNGAVIDTLAPNGTGLAAPVWRQATYVVRASGSDTLSFSESGITGDTVGALLDAVSLTDGGPSTVTLATPAGNLAYGKTASMPAASYATAASYAVDGNVDGIWQDNSVAISSGVAPQDFWEVDLGSVDTLQSVKLFNRTDCCATRLNNFYVLSSATSMDGQTLAQLLANPAVTKQYVAAFGYVAANMPQDFSVDMGNVTGRYVRIQLAGTNQLQLAEVEVMGWVAGAR